MPSAWAAAHIASPAVAAPWHRTQHIHTGTQSGKVLVGKYVLEEANRGWSGTKPDHIDDQTNIIATAVARVRGWTSFGQLHKPAHTKAS